MKKIILAVLMFVCIGCNNDDSQVNYDYTSFLNLTNPQFKGKINNTSLLWEFGIGTYQMNSGYFYPGGNSDDTNRLLKFVLNQENGDNQFVISAPVFDTSSEIEFNKVFGLGLKKIGDSDNDYHISIRYDNRNFQICNSDANYKLEILKTKEIFSQNLKILKVWFKIENIELNNCNPNVDYDLNDGFLIAEFTGYKSE